MIKDIYNDMDAKLITSITTPMQNKEDSWFWILEESGSFSVRSCYRKIQGEQTWEHASFWLKLWSLELPGKVISFIWRVCKLCLPIVVNLAMRRVQIDPNCTWCLV